MSEKETIARASVRHNVYAGTVDMEARCMLDMIQGYHIAIT